MQEYGDMKQIMNAEQTQIESLWESMRSLLKEGFVSDESDIGAARWESILDIIPLDTDTLQLRNFRIHSSLVVDLPYTYQNLNDQIEAICGKDEYELNLYGDIFKLSIKLALTIKKMKPEVEKLCERVVPLNLFLDIDLIYNTHGLIHSYSYTHSDLHSLTHQQVKDEPYWSPNSDIYIKGGKKDGNN